MFSVLQLSSRFGALKWGMMDIFILECFVTQNSAARTILHPLADVEIS